MNHVIAWGILTTASLAALVVWIDAGEPPIGDTREIVLPDSLFNVVTDSFNSNDQSDESPLGIARIQPSSSRDEDREGNPGPEARQAAFKDFHDEFRNQFARIEGEFGLARMPQMPDVNRINHAATDNSIWNIFESPLGVQIRRGQQFLDADGDITVDALAVPQTVIQPAQFPAIGELQSPSSLGGNPERMFGEPPLGLFDDVMTAISEPAAKSSWKLVRLELIGLRDHGIPVSVAAPQMAKGNRLNRGLAVASNEFERSAIQQLLSKLDADVIVQEEREEIQVVGALRATERCQSCHDVRRGELLGGLTYRLIRLPDGPTPRHKLKRGQSIAWSNP